MAVTEATGRPLRKDAERNRRLILDAARELFSERGLGVSLNEIARHAGVGVGTVYRRFPDKSELIESLFEEGFEQVVARMQTALDDPDPWHGLVTFLQSNFEAQCADQGLRELITDSREGLARIARIRERMMPMSAELVRRAHADGTLRGDIEASDLAVVQVMISSVLDASREVSPELWRRYVGILLRGLSTDPDALGPLAAEPLAPEQVERVLSAHKLARR